MSDINEITSALDEASESADRAQSSIEDVFQYADDCKNEAESAQDHISTVRLELDSVIDIMRGMGDPEGIDPIEGKVFMTDMLTMIDDITEALTRGRARLFDRAKDWKIELKEE